MKKNIENVKFHKRGEDFGEFTRTGVSLHCHTLHSKELLDFVPYYASRIPIASYFWNRHIRHSEKQYGSTPDFSKGYWTPPLTGLEVFNSERDHLARLGLEAIVSITDHDSINANLEIRSDIDSGRSPISMEWTVPFEEGFFHVGVHNLPAESAETITAELLDYTHRKGRPDNTRLHELFELLNQFPDVLIVLNHPIWDIEMVGQHAHERVLEKFVAEHAKWIHAIEINGFRSWAENVAAAELATSLGLPLVSGGDRHCLQHNTMINVTNAKDFAEFAGEIRQDHHSEIVVMPEYSDPLPCRQLRSISQILGTYSHFPESRRSWSDRVYLDYNDGGGLKTLSEHWNGEIPKWTYPAFLALALLSHRVAQPLIALAVGDRDIGRNEEKLTNTSFAMEDSPLSA